MEDFYEHIDDYIEGLLEGEALKRFEAEMETNASLKKAVENYDSAKAISEGLLEVDMMETLRRLKEGEHNADTEGGAVVHELPDAERGVEPAKPRLNIRRWVAAASFIGLMVFAGWWVMDWNVDRIYLAEINENYEWPIDEDAIKSGDTIGMNDFEKGKYYFNRNLFEESIEFFEKYVMQVSDRTLQSKGYLWLGASYIRLKRIKDAKEALRKSNEESARKNLKLLTR